jgi:hypothetical protein
MDKCIIQIQMIESIANYKFINKKRNNKKYVIKMYVLKIEKRFQKKYQKKSNKIYDFFLTH